MRFLHLLFPAILLIAHPAFSQERFVVGYFNEWPIPAHYGRQTGAYDTALGLAVDWRTFTDSQSLIEAVANGEVQIGLSVGVTPLIVAASRGRSVKIIDISVSYPEIENCYSRGRLDVSTENPAPIMDAVIGLPIGTSIHYSLNMQVESMGLDPDRLNIQDMTPRTAVAKFLDGSIDIACGWGLSLEQLEGEAVPLFDYSALQTSGVRIFDAVITEDFYAQANADKIVSFLGIINDINEDVQTYSDPILPYLPPLVSMNAESASSLLNLFELPTLDEKLGEGWLGGTVQDYMQNLGSFYAEQATLNSAPDNLQALVDTRYLQMLQDQLTASPLPPEQEQDNPDTGQQDPEALSE